MPSSRAVARVALGQRPTPFAGNAVAALDVLPIIEVIAEHFLGHSGGLGLYLAVALVGDSDRITAADSLESILAAPPILVDAIPIFVAALKKFLV